MLVALIQTVALDGRELDLTLGRTYEVLGIEAGDYRLLSDEDHEHWPNDPFLYEAKCFRIVDGTEPGFWVTQFGEEGERYSYPKEWLAAGFFEDYHDGVSDVRAEFWRDLGRLYPRTYQERLGTSKQADADGRPLRGPR